jgi:hypothetical protein
MDDEQIRRYLESAAALHGLSLDDDQLARVAIVMGRNAAIAIELMAFDLPEEVEMAPTSRMAES